MRQYMAVRIIFPDTILPGHMLCEASSGTKENHCMIGFEDSAGEFQGQGNKGSGVSWIAITSFQHKKKIYGASDQYIGVIRNWTGPASTAYKDILRCFSTPNQACGVPSSASIPLNGVPYLIQYLPVVPLKNLNAAENSAGVPTGPIVGALLTTPPASTTTDDYWNFGIVKIGQSSDTKSCTKQPPPYTTDQTKNLVVYVKNVPFGGNIGTQDAIVIDGFACQNSPRCHMERYFYVKGYGQVRAGVSFWVKGDQFGASPAYNQVFSYYEFYNASYFNLRADNCAQGSAIPLWPSGTSSDLRRTY
jgi:hypothetical protein